MPYIFRLNFPQCRVIIDCTKFVIQKPSDPKAQQLTFNNYKNSNTVKCLIGISPSGGISFISERWTDYCSTPGYSGSADLPPTVGSGGSGGENMDWSKFPLTVINFDSPGGKFGATWLDSLYSQISSPFVLLGDFNIHHPALGSYHSSSDANLVLDWISTKYMCLLNMNSFTRYQET
ncbi:hypothetical protein AVEN_66051-1 [Araneus ventricosus]|uniref:Endonuclease/exonuclease/phosphatase domain-containing protein n=1 Tax=Araneus ventricosus TaxID=182803 RepID=A0A4Y2JZ21_ARAVE|nr:hypothetical protein AVEN_66051-1 [Araneus ventricosus]